MKAIVLVPGEASLHLKDRENPTLGPRGEILVQVLQVGICGTDREEAAGGRSRAPDGTKELVIGHEMLGRVLEVGKTITRVRAGDLCVLTVRRQCGTCISCLMNRPDMCTSGNFRERGIWGLDGYQAELVVDEEQNAIQVPPALESIAVLTEPMSIVEKAIDEAVRVQFARLPDALASPDWLFGRRCLVAGLGPVGLLGALALRLRGADVYGLDIVDETTSRPQWLEMIGGKYIDGRKVPAERVVRDMGPMDLILEAAGIASLDYDLFDALAANGVYVLTGIPAGDRPVQISGAALMRKLVLNNQLVLGSVNAARDYFQMAVNDLVDARSVWGDLVGRLITHRYAPAEFARAFGQHPADEIKAIIDWTQR